MELNKLDDEVLEQVVGGSHLENDTVEVGKWYKHTTAEFPIDAYDNGHIYYCKSALGGNRFLFTAYNIRALSDGYHYTCLGDEEMLGLGLRMVSAPLLDR